MLRFVFRVTILGCLLGFLFIGAPLYNTIQPTVTVDVPERLSVEDLELPSLPEFERLTGENE